MPVLLQLNLATSKWSMVENDPEPYSTTLEIGFVGDTVPVVFDNLSFGFSYKVDEFDEVALSYPVADVQYVSTDQDYVTADMIEAGPDSTVSINVWAENAGQRYEDSFSYVVPKPASPFPSWIWSPEIDGWVAPVAKPQEESPTGNGYMWDEETQSWTPRPADPEV